MTLSDPPLPPPATPFERYVAEVVALGGPLSSIADHMVRNGGSPTSIPDILGGLLRDTLSPLAEHYGDEILDAAASLLHETCDVVCSEIYLVPLNRAQRRAARRRSGCD